MRAKCVLRILIFIGVDEDIRLGDTKTESLFELLFTFFYSDFISDIVMININVYNHYYILL